MKILLIFIVILIVILFKNDIKYFLDVNFSEFDTTYVDITKTSNVHKNILIYSADNRDDNYIKLTLY